MEWINNYLYLFWCFIILVHQVSSISDLRRCGNEDCTEPLSRAKTIINYLSPNKNVLSFTKNENVIVYSKSAGIDLKYYGVEINGRRGYAPKEFLKITENFKKPTLLVPTEFYELVDGVLVLKKDIAKEEVVHKINQHSVNIEDVQRENVNIEDKSLPSNVNSEPLPNAVSPDQSPTLGEAIGDSPIQTDNSQGVTGNSDDPASAPVNTLIEGSTDTENDEELIDDGDEDDEDFTESGDEELNVLSEILEPENQPTTVHSETPSVETAAPEYESVKSAIDTVDIQNSTAPIEIKLDKIDNETVDLSKDFNNVNSHIDVHKDLPSPDINSVHQLSSGPEIIQGMDELVINATDKDAPVDGESDNVTSNNYVLPSDSQVPNTIIQTSNDKTDSISVNQNTQNFVPESGSQVDINSYVSEKGANGALGNEVPAEPMISIVPGTTDTSRGGETYSNDYHDVSNNITGSEAILNEVNEIRDSPSAAHINNPSPIVNINSHPTLERNTVESVPNEYLKNEKMDALPPANRGYNYLKPKSSIHIPNTDRHAHNKKENVVEILRNDTELFDMNNFNDSNILDKDLANQFQAEIPIQNTVSTDHPYLPTERPPEIATGVDILQNDVPITPVYPPEASSQSIQYPGHITREAESSDSAHNPTLDIPPQVEENVNNFGSYLSNNVDNTHSVNISPDKMTDSAPELKENMSELKEDTLIQSEGNILDDVNKNILINDQDMVESISVDGQVDGSFVENTLKIFDNLYGHIFSLFKSTKFTRDVDPQDIILEDKRTEASTKSSSEIGAPGVSHDSVSSMFTATSPPQCLAEERVEGWSEVSTDKIFWLVISAVSILVFTLGYYYLENRKQDGKLLAMVNSLQKELLCSSKECIILKDDLTVTKEKLCGIEDSSFGSDEMVACLKKELVDSNQTISDLHDKLAVAEEELANSTEAALELQAILDEQLSSKNTSSSSLTFTVSNLQAQLDDQQTTMNQTKAQLAAKVEENEMLLLKIIDIGNKSTSMEKELTECQGQLRQAREECEAKAGQLQDLGSNLEKSLRQSKEQRTAEVKELKLQIKNQKDELETTKVALKARAHEVTSLQENLKLLKLDSKNIDAILDTSHTKAELTQAISEKKLLADKLETEQSLLLELSNKVEEQDAKMAQMKVQLNEAEQKAIQATSRLEVLTNYFNQKEADLLKELSLKESLWLSQQGEAMSTVEKIQSLQQEIQQYKDTAESVRRELAEQEAAWRARGAALERRAHEQWLARRAAERVAEAGAQEAQTLRQRLAANAPDAADKRVVSPLIADVVPDLGMLPPPLPFLPPPLPPPFLPPPLPPHRPPPLGRLSSPPPPMHAHRYLPDSRYSPDRDYSPDRHSTPHRVRSPFSQDSRRRGYNNRRYDDDDRYYDNGDRSRRYDETETDLSPPPSPRPPRRVGPRNHKGVSSGSGHSSESLERTSKHSGKY